MTKNQVTVEDYFKESDRYDEDDVAKIPKEVRVEINTKLNEIESGSTAN